ncbi:BRISC and BRCA1-A complex member 2-like [Chelonus insularis]|uniref:BRISC and BRCA1-A complex member 2-like n=1 Tax=Chelonus insularis TaxID=460826 RepID=UPI00158F4993|nr:BRISC and BRCA1-A complex member 2-like [Chelonus insularis]XP_034945719.1 BRISC and BRCA1-A complex member 2-like [Chelonus insularis]
MELQNSPCNSPNGSNSKSNKNFLKINSNLEVYFNRIFKTKFFGLKCGKIILNHTCANNGILSEDCFRVSIPYANQILTWTVYFNIRNPDLGPDFDFDDKFFLNDPDLDDFEKNVPSLMNWDSEDSNSLLKVITELVLYYKKYQVDYLYKHGGHLVYEYDNLLSKTEICDEDVEMILLPTVINPSEVHFLIRIAVDFSRLPKKSYLCNYDIIVLHIMYRGNNWNRITPQLLISKNLEEILGESNNFHLPPVSTERHLMDYVLEIKKLVSTKIDSIILSSRKRKEFVNTALCLQGSSVVEYDNIEFSFISFLLNHKDFYFFLHFHLTPNFPIQPPKITLQSCYHLANKDELYKTTLSNNFPYNPLWEPEQMFTKILIYLIENEISTFQTNSIKNKRT